MAKVGRPRIFGKPFMVRLDPDRLEQLERLRGDLAELGHPHTLSEAFRFLTEVALEALGRREAGRAAGAPEPPSPDPPLPREAA